MLTQSRGPGHVIRLDQFLTPAWILSKFQYFTGFVYYLFHLS